MSDYTPSEKDVRLTFAYIQGGLDLDEGHEPSYQAHEAEFDRFIAKVKADALREAAEKIREVALDLSREAAPYHHGVQYGQRLAAGWLDIRADRIEGEV